MPDSAHPLCCILLSPFFGSKSHEARFAGEKHENKAHTKSNKRNMSALHTVFTHALLSTFFLKAYVHCQVLVCM